MKLITRICIIMMVCFNTITSVNSQSIVVDKVETDISNISIEDLRRRIEKLIIPGEYPYYIDISLLSMDEEKMDGLDNKYVVSADLTIQVVDYLNEVTVDQKLFRITSSGKSVTKAQNRLLKSLNSQKKKIIGFLKDTGKNIPALSCNDRIRVANRNIELNKLAAAASISRSKDSACSDQLADIRLKIFDQYQQRYCNRHIINAQALLSAKKYELAIDEVLGLSPESNCHNELENIIAEIKSDYQKDYSEQFDAYLKILEMDNLDRQARLKLLELVQIKQLSEDD